jgi:tetratricopeptide (TPR) repeat protein
LNPQERYTNGNYWLITLLIVLFLCAYAGIPPYRETDPALLQLQDAVRQNPSDPQIRAELAAVYFQKYKEAKQQHYLEGTITEARGALRLDPNCGLAHFYLSLALLEKGTEREDEALLDEAVREYKEALRTGPGLAVAEGFPPAQFLSATKCLALSERDEGLIDVAVRELQEAIRVKPGYAPSHAILGGIHYHLKGEKERAICELKEAIRCNSEYLEAHKWLAGIYKVELQRAGAERDEDTIELAIQEYGAVIRLNPQDDEAHRELSWVYRCKGSFGLSEAEAEAALRLKRNAENYKALGDACLWKGNYAQAREELQEAMRSRPQYQEARYSLAFTCYLEQRFEEAVEESSRWMKLEEPLGAETILLRYLSLQGMGKQVEAEELLEEFSRCFAGEVWHSNVLAYHRGELRESELLSRARHDFDRCTAYFHIGCRYLHRGDHEKAKLFFKKCVDTKIFYSFEYIGSRSKLQWLSAK